MSRRDGTIVAWHEVPGKAPPQRYGVTRAGVRIDSMIGIRVGVSQVQETVRYIEQQLDIIGGGLFTGVPSVSEAARAFDALSLLMPGAPFR